jgi:hypothetical protein
MFGDFFRFRGLHGHHKHFGIGTPGDDIINGTNGSDVIFALSGDDQIYAAGGNDTVFGSRGNDLIDGGKGNDLLFGDKGNDALIGGDGKDLLSAGDGRDFIVGGTGDDALDGGRDSDTFVFRIGMDKDHVLNFRAEDRLDLRDFGFASPQDALDAFHQVGRDSVLDLGNGDKVVLDHYNVANLTTAQLITSDLQQGPSSSQTPYLVNMDPDVSFTSVLTAGDQADNGYQMAGTPDGLGAFDNGDGTFTLLVNHEFGTTAGAVHAHGATGSFISSWTIDKTTLQVLDGKDLIQHVHLYDTATDSFYDPVTDGNPATDPVQFSRFCSADLAATTAFYNPETGLGYDGGRIFLNGEEDGPPFGPPGRAFAHFASGSQSGNTYELPWLGKLAHENVVASPYTGDSTVVATMDDSSPTGQVYFYLGQKQATGSDLDKAGLIGGDFYGIKVDEMLTETTGADPLGADNVSSFTMYNFGDVSEKSGAALESEGLGNVTGFLRPEDGAWDTVNQDRFYFVTTDAFSAPSRLWAVDFVDASHPELGGTIKLLLNGTEGQHMLDNLTVNAQGHVIMQEDIGGNAALGKIWDYDPFNDSLTLIAQHDPDRFDPSAPPGGEPFLTQDEESSGILDISDILGSAGQNAYLLDVQAHYANGPTLVEGGQLLLMHQDLV